MKDKVQGMQAQLWDSVWVPSQSSVPLSSETTGEQDPWIAMRPWLSCLFPAPFRLHFTGEAVATHNMQSNYLQNKGGLRAFFNAKGSVQTLKSSGNVLWRKVQSDRDWAQLIFLFILKLVIFHIYFLMVWDHQIYIHWTSTSAQYYSKCGLWVDVVNQSTMVIKGKHLFL